MASVYSVSQVNAYIKNMFAQDFALNRIQVKGEVSNLKYHTSGHIYFTLKDGSGTLAAVMFKSYAAGLKFRMEEGQQVVVRGSVEVYERDGKYQLYAREIEQAGTGDLYRRFILLRDTLEEMGMFAPEYKRPIPRYAKTVGIVTAATGAAIRDIMNISARRNPYVQLILYPAQVQGEGAVPSIVKGIRTLDQLGVDVIIVGRGGGSIEDLWAFNEESVARAIFSCRTPVISAVGHETDVTIADYVADLRAPTPSAAAELAVFDYAQFEGQVNYFRNRLAVLMERKIENLRLKNEQYRLKIKFYDPERQLNEKRKRLADLEDALRRLAVQAVKDGRQRLALLAGRLHSESPLQKLSRGFGFVTDSGGKPMESVGQAEPGDAIKVRLKDGSLEARVIGKEHL